jgi:hypothetical protein
VAWLSPVFWYVGDGLKSPIALLHHCSFSWPRKTTASCGSLKLKSVMLLCQGLMLNPMVHMTHMTCHFWCGLWSGDKKINDFPDIMVSYSNYLWYMVVLVHVLRLLFLRKGIDVWSR